MKDKKVVFMGTPYFACKVLEKLIKNANVIAVVTQPDKEVGRKKILASSLVKQFAMENNIKVLTPKKISECVNEINELGADIYITAAYGQMLPEKLINYPEFKTINVHGSLLPRLRGGAPIQRSIMNGDLKTGVTIMQTNKGMDSGDIILKEELIIENNYDYSILNEKLADLGSKLLIDVLPSIFDKSAIYNKQDEKEVTFAPLIKREDEHINFNKKSKDVFNQIRGLSKEPGAYSIIDGDGIKIYTSYIGEKTDNEPGVITNIYKEGIGIATLDNELVITKIKPAGKKIMDVKDYLNGFKGENLLGKKLK